MIRLVDGDSIKPVFSKDVVPVCFSANNSYIPQTAVMIRSIIANAVDEKNYDIIILSTDISEVNESNVVGLGDGKDNISIRIFDIDNIIGEVQFYTDSVYTPTTYSKEAYFRLFIPFVMPEYQTVIYFDGDMAAVCDISPLMDIDMSNYIAAATRDFCGIAACYDPGSDRMEYRNEIGIKDQEAYFISSMVVLNIEKFRNKHSIDDVKTMISSRNWRQHDQDILNILCQDELLIVDAKWSYFEELEYSVLYLNEELKQELFEAKKNACVVHYAGQNKAWVDEKSSLTYYFWKYASETPYFDEFFAKVSNNSCYRHHILNDIVGKKLEYYYDGADIVLLSTPHYIGRISNLKVCIEFLSIKNNTVSISGFFETIDALGRLKLFVTLNGIGIPTYNSDEYRRYGTSSMVKTMRDFKVDLPLDVNLQNNMVGFGMTYDDVHFIFPSYVSVEQFAPINEYGYSFYSSEGYIVTKQEGKVLEIAKHSRKKIFALNREICKYLKSKKEKYFDKLARVRWLYYITKPFMRKKNIWLVSGKDAQIDGNILEFFKYLKTRPEIQAYLVVGVGDKNFDELKKLGNVILARSKMHKFYFLHSKVNMASEYNIEFFMPTCNRANEVRDMVANKKIVYWHDGVENLEYNVKPWYNVHKFLVPSQEVYDFIVNGNNGYNENNIVLCDNGFDESVYADIVEKINKD